MSRARSIRVLIVDDEKPARDLLGRLLANESDCEVVGECGTSEEAEQSLEGGVDLVFLDVQLPDATGLELIDRFGADRFPAVIFVTAHDQFAVRAFELSAVDYLLKPFAKARFYDALSRAREKIGRGNSAAQMARLRLLWARGKPDSGMSPYLDQLKIQAGASMSYLPVPDIDRIEADDHCLRVWSRGRMHVVSGTISGMESQLDPAHFVRIHRRVIVQIARIVAVRKTAGGSFEVQLRDGSLHSLSRRRRDLVDMLLPRGSDTPGEDSSQPLR
jgi:two-component system LytT family response regulator